jgi:hypothetical protein
LHLLPSLFVGVLGKESSENSFRDGPQPLNGVPGTAKATIEKQFNLVFFTELSYYLAMVDSQVVKENGNTLFLLAVGPALL